MKDHPKDLPIPDPGDAGDDAPRARPGVFSMKNPSPADRVRPAKEIKAAASDSRLASVERLVGRNQWAEVCAELAPDPASAESLPPALALVHAVALKESSPDARDADRRAIAAIADLLGVARDSPLALVLGKRLARRRNWGETPAPSRGVSTLVVIAGLAIGVLVGWLITFLHF